jgi:hypothetical protein
MMPQIYDWLAASIARGDADFYKTIVIDSLSELHKRAMDAVLINEKHDMPHQADWGRSMEYIRRVVRKFRDLPIHTVFVMGSVFKEDPTTGMSEHMPNLPGKLAPEVSGYFDILGYLNMERARPGEFERRLRVQPSPKWRAKDRTSTLGAFLGEDQLDLSKVIGYINGKETSVVVTDNAELSTGVLPVGT